MRLLTTVFLLMLTLIVCQAQSSDIEVKTSFWTGTKFYQDDQKLDKSELRNILSVNENTLGLLNKGLRQQSTATIIAGIGGAFIGWPLGSLIGGGDPQWILAGIGAGVIIIGIPIYASGGKKIVSAIDMYNGKSLSSILPKGENYTVSVVSSNRGIGVQIDF